MKDATGILSRFRRGWSWLPCLAAGLLGGCSLVDEDLSGCRYGCEVSFEYRIYDADGGNADAFATAVDRVRLYVFDIAGQLVRVCPLGNAATPAVDFPAEIDLPAGEYDFVAWAGKDGYDFTLPASPAVTDEATATLPLDAGGVSAKSLHPLFHGRRRVRLTEGFDHVRIPLIKDTRTFRIVLQHTDGSPVTADDFVFSITDDNALLGADNLPVEGHTATYRPYATGQTPADDKATGAGPGAAWADFATSRLVEGNAPRLHITRTADGETVLDLPLLDYLYLIRPAGSLTAQQFLDRHDHWSLVFFLDGGRWVTTHIIINGWIVRPNGTDV